MEHCAKSRIFVGVAATARAHVHGFPMLGVGSRARAGACKCGDDTHYPMHPSSAAGASAVDGSSSAGPRPSTNVNEHRRHTECPSVLVSVARRNTRSTSKGNASPHQKQLSHSRRRPPRALDVLASAAAGALSVAGGARAAAGGARAAAGGTRAAACGARRAGSCTGGFALVPPALDGRALAAASAVTTVRFPFLLSMAACASSIVANWCPWLSTHTNGWSSAALPGGARRRLSFQPGGISVGAAPLDGRFLLPSSRRRLLAPDDEGRDVVRKYASTSRRAPSRFASGSQVLPSSP